MVRWSESQDLERFLQRFGPGSSISGTHYLENHDLRAGHKIDACCVKCLRLIRLRNCLGAGGPSCAAHRIEPPQYRYQISELLVQD